MGVTDIKSQTEFAAAVESTAGAQAASTGKSVIIIDCFAEWCGPCKAISPVVEKMSNEYPKVGFYKIDVDNVPDVSQELGVRAMPTFFLFKDGEKIDEIVGAVPGNIKNALDKHSA